MTLLAATMLVGAAAAVLASAAHAEPLSFDSDKPGTPPAGWACGSTGGGSPRWTVETDATAPSKANVLKQSGSGPFPWCVKTSTALTDGIVEVKFKPPHLCRATSGLHCAPNSEAPTFASCWTARPRSSWTTAT